MVTTRPLFTRADYARLPEGFPAELVCGELVKETSPTYGHRIYVGDIHAALVVLAGRTRAIVGPVDVPIGENDVYKPDVVVFAKPVPIDVGGTEVPAVVFEVLSPSSRRLDAGVKRKRYLAAGVEEVWLVDPESKGVEVHTRAGVDAAVGSDVVRSAAVPGFELVPDRLFAGPG